MGIYKDYPYSIYNNGVYNNGAGGGGGDTTVTIGGKLYRTVTIGGVTWLAENLDYKFNGCGIGGSGSPITPNAWYFNNNEAIYGIDGVRKCGLLYNWYAIKLLNDNRSKLIPGWHVPTIDEWTNLVNSVGGESVAATRLKAENLSWAPSWGGTDDFGFGVVSSGYYDKGGFVGDTDSAYFSTITESGDNVDRTYFGPGAIINFFSSSKIFGFSLRLVKDP